MSVAIFALPLMLLLILGVFVSLGVYVYKDAKARGMDPALWTLIALLVPSLIGFVIYLVVRTSHSALTCPQCGKRVTEQFTVCPQCGARLKATCPGCGAPVEQGWRVCPQCAAPLPQTGAVTAPKSRKDSSLGKILALIIVVPLLLIILLGIAFSAFTTGPSTFSSATTMWEYEEFQEASQGTAAGDWLASCGTDEAAAYVLRYEEKDSEANRYLVYIPGATGSVDFYISREKTLWRSCNCLEVHNMEEGEPLILWIVVDSGKTLPLDVYLDGQKLKTVLTETDSYPIPEALHASDIDELPYE